jgi:agmatine deiminase
MTTKPVLNSDEKSRVLPASHGFIMPAEWSEHEATWLAWPHHRGTWPGRGRLERVRSTILEIIETLLPHEKVRLLVSNRVEREEVTRLLKERDALNPNLFFHEAATADIWIRDYGPVFLKKPQGEKSWVKWIFNAWGRKYPSSLKDNDIFQKGAPLISHPCFEAGMVLEGGSIDVNGHGECLVTEQCLLNRNRNPSLSRSAIEKKLGEYLGINCVIWLSGGIEGDDTDGHIDNIARFAGPDTVLVSYEDDSQDENYAVLKRNWRRLKAFSSRRKRPVQMVKLPMPGRIMHGRMRLPASYANFYIANQIVLLPVYDHANDQRAAKILKEHFPTRRIIPISCRDIVYGLGAIHCLTQQEPK